MRAPGRREIGHGHLAERALVPILPPVEEFPYTLRLISETLESNGSSSMASVCGSTLALMDAGVPIKKHVAGVAMGLVLHGKKHAILTDIQGMEDALGEMDFKVAGTVDGITAIQMDIKVQGITIEIMREAMIEAKKSRLFIIEKLKETIAAARPELSEFAPRMIVLQIDPDKIKSVIGPGGKVINKIIADTGVKIDIENDGRVFIAGTDGIGAEKAKKMVEALTKDVVVGETYMGTVTRLMNFGAFVAVLPGKEGLVHISQLAPGRVERVGRCGESGRRDHGEGRRDRLPRPHQPQSQGRARRRPRGRVRAAATPRQRRIPPQRRRPWRRRPAPARVTRAAASKPASSKYGSPAEMPGFVAKGS